MVHPWHRLRDLGDEWALVWHLATDDARMGVTRFGSKEISLRSDLTWEERRCTALHEAIHAERGPTLEGVLAEREELAVRRQVARLMLPDIKAIGEAMAWAFDTEEAAEELMVDVGVLRDRLQWLHPAERGYLHRRLEEV